MTWNLALSLNAASGLLLVALALGNLAYSRPRAPTALLVALAVWGLCVLAAALAALMGGPAWLWILSEVLGLAQAAAFLVFARRIHHVYPIPVLLVFSLLVFVCLVGLLVKPSSILTFTSNDGAVVPVPGPLHTLVVDAPEDLALACALFVLAEGTRYFNRRSWLLATGLVLAWDYTIAYASSWQEGIDPNSLLAALLAGSFLACAFIATARLIHHADRSGPSGMLLASLVTLFLASGIYSTNIGAHWWNSPGLVRILATCTLLAPALLRRLPQADSIAESPHAASPQSAPS